MAGAVVLFSGGQDSTTCLHWARTMFDRVEAVSVDYGQRHAKELEAGAEIARRAGIERTVYDLRVLSQLADSALVDATREIAASGGAVDSEAPGGLPTSFVPGRNALLLTVAAAHAVKRGMRDVVTGVCQTDFSGYPDCRRGFVDALEVALGEAFPSSVGPIRISTPLMYLTKAESVRLARRLGPECWGALGLTVTCYHGKRPGCGECPACLVRARGFAEAGEMDPAEGR